MGSHAHVREDPRTNARHVAHPALVARDKNTDAAATRLAMLEPVLLKASSSAVDLDVASPLPPNNLSTISKLFLSEFKTEVPSLFVSTRFDPSFLLSWRPAYLISSLDAQLCTKFNLRFLK